MHFPNTPTSPDEFAEMVEQEHLDAPLDRAHRGAVLGCQVTETSFALPVSLCDGISGLQGQVRKGRTPDRLTLRPGVPEASASIRRAAYWTSEGPRSRLSVS